MPELVLDATSATHLLTRGCVSTLGDVDVLSIDAYVIYANEYAVVYRSSLSRRCPERLHDVARLMAQPCACLKGGTPLLTSSVLAAVVDPPLRVRPLAPELLALRLQLAVAYPQLSARESALLAALLRDPAPALCCTCSDFSHLLDCGSDLDLTIMELDHQS